MRAAIYARISVQDDASTSIERQLADCRALLQARQWTPAGEYVDVDVSAYSGVRRPEFERMLEELDAFDVIVFWKVDRLARSALAFQQVMSKTLARDVALTSCTEPLDLSSPVGRAMAGVISVFAELESATISLRVRSSHRYRVSLGLHRAGKPPFGWRSERGADGPRLVLNEEQAPVLREAVRRVLAGESCGPVSRDLGVRNLWRKLREPHLAGWSTHNGEIIRGEDGLPLRCGEPLLDPATWRQLQAVLDARKLDRRPRQPSRLLTGVMRCAHCHQAMHTQRMPAKINYTCPCSTSISAELADRVVVEALLESFGTLAMAEPVVTPDYDGRLEEVLVALSDLERDRYERGLFRGPEGTARFAELYGRLEAQREDLVAAPRATEPEWRPTGRTFAEAWAEADVPEQREIVRSAFRVIEVTKIGRGHRSTPDRIRLELA